MSDRRYVPANDRTYEPTEDPGWWRDVEECDRSWCGHPVHAFGHTGPLRHLEQASVIEAEGVPLPEWGYPGPYAGPCGSQEEASECGPKSGWLTGDIYCAAHGRAAGWPCRGEVSS